jgi:uncharacterized protein YbjT (DUF2867 family)
MIVITGATGVVGRPLVDQLGAEGAAVRAVTRTPHAAGFPASVDVVSADPGKPSTMTAALAGATTLFLHPRAVGDAADELVALARELGVRRVVALAAANVDDADTDQPSRLRGDRNREAEYAAVNSGLEWTSLRPSSFAINTLGAWGAQIRAGDVVRYVYGAFEESLIHELDLAEVAARALLSDDLLGRRLELTGPQSLSHAEQVAVIGDVIGRPLRFEEVPPSAAMRGMLRNGLPEPFVTALLARYAAHVARAQYPPTREVEHVLGRPARTYAQWVTDHAAAFTAEGDL